MNLRAGTGSEVRCSSRQRPSKLAHDADKISGSGSSVGPRKRPGRFELEGPACKLRTAARPLAETVNRRRDQQTERPARQMCPNAHTQAPPPGATTSGSTSHTGRMHRERQMNGGVVPAEAGVCKTNVGFEESTRAKRRRGASYEPLTRHRKLERLSFSGLSRRRVASPKQSCETTSGIDASKSAAGALCKIVSTCRRVVFRGRTYIAARGGNLYWKAFIPMENAYQRGPCKRLRQPLRRT